MLSSNAAANRRAFRSLIPVVESLPHHLRQRQRQQLPTSSSSSSLLFNKHYHNNNIDNHNNNNIDIPRRSYFTNGQVTKKNDPYAILGLQWGDGATSSDIKQAFRDKARQLHPDVNKTDSPAVALQKFQELQKAYEALIKNVSHDDLKDFDEWRVAIWRQGDRIAMDRTDVAGVKRKRPVQPATINNSKVYSRELGHPDGRGAVSSTVRAEYLGNGRKSSSSVGTGRNKWVTPKEFKPWNGGGGGKNGSDNADGNDWASTK